ncbi:NifB/NifX family molybdenum-iron cluster-binding protein [Maridesulfovibrio zosterae]|uniref:NifB/NifX family molybdenum-iron cluster-binding protein n=1 Tax=Maridesulfovibrio zosterae TaxID=82171 RepID=UPI00040B19AD|nr:NifB/NifX family molybdenum-iron cluster-binding protein [Maridesulfovibrio zosterae]
MTSSNFSSHPCFGSSARASIGRVHLPVAPKSYARIRFTPEIKSPVAMQPEAAVCMLDSLIEEGKKIKVVGITGPGDPLASFNTTSSTLMLVRTKYPAMNLCLTTLGIGGTECVKNLVTLNLSHITVLVDAVDPSVAAKLYAWIRPSTKNVPLPEAAKLLIKEQARSIAAFKKAGLTVKINTTLYPENIDHIEDIAKAVKELGADIMSITPFIPAEDSNFSSVTNEQIEEARKLAGKHIELMAPWVKCGAEIDVEAPCECTMPKPTKSRPNVAVVSSSGMDVDLHLGHTRQVIIYGPRQDGLACLLETRPTPEPGGGSARWEKLAETLNDCFALICAGAGDNPKQILGSKGINVIVSEDNVEGLVDVLYGGGKKGKKCK